MKGILSRSIFFVISLLCFATVGMSVIFKWDKIKSEDSVWKLRMDFYDSWRGRDIFASKNFIFNYVGDIPQEYFRRYSFGSFSYGNYRDFIGEKFNKYKADFLNKKKGIGSYSFYLKHVRTYILLKPDKDNILRAVGYSFYRPQEELYLCCNNSRLLFKDGKIKISGSIPRARMPFSEDESKTLCKVIDKFNKQNRKLE